MSRLTAASYCPRDYGICLSEASSYSCCSASTKCHASLLSSMKTASYLLHFLCFIQAIPFSLALQATLQLPYALMYISIFLVTLALNVVVFSWFEKMTMKLCFEGTSCKTWQLLKTKWESGKKDGLEILSRYYDICNKLTITMWFPGCHYSLMILLNKVKWLYPLRHTVWQVEFPWRCLVQLPVKKNKKSPWKTVISSQTFPNKPHHFRPFYLLDIEGVFSSFSIFECLSSLLTADIATLLTIRCWEYS